MVDEGARTDDSRAPRTFLRRSLIVLGLASLFVAGGLLLWNALDVFLLAFAAVLLATFLNTPARFVSSRTPISHGIALATVVVALIALAVGLGFLAGPRIADQAGQLVERLPESAGQIQDFVRGLPGGAWLMERMQSGEGSVLSGSGVISRITGTATLFWDIAAKVIFVVFLGLYLAASPRTYRDGLAALVPPAARPRALEVLNRIGRALQGWLLGKLVSMLLVGILVFVGLSLLGTPLALILGLIAGLFEFVPIIGPFAAFVPAALLALAGSASQVLWVIVLYLVVQQVEGQIIVPLVQRSTVDLPPALTISAIFVGGAAFGLLGFLVATPLAAVLLVLIDMLYRHDVLGEHVHLPAGGEE